MGYNDVVAICQSLDITPPSKSQYYKNKYNNAPLRRAVSWSVKEDLLLVEITDRSCVNTAARTLMRDVASMGIRLHRIGGAKYSQVTQVTTKEDQPIKKETEMKSPIVETKTFVNGQDVAHTHAEDLLKMVVALESQINELQSIKTESKFVRARIAAKQADLAAVVTLLDAKV